MKNLLNKVLLAIVTIMSVFILGMLFPGLVSIFLIITDQADVRDILQSGPFWVVSFIGWFMSIFYINDALTMKK
jgi:hypothetical protein